MPLLFDDRNWNAIMKASQQFADMQAVIENATQSMSNSFAQRQIDLLNSLAFQRHLNLINAIDPIVHRYANQVNTLMNYRHTHQYIEQLQRDLLLQEPEEHEVFEYPETELILPEIRERIIIYSPSQLLLEQLRQQRISLHDIHWRQFEEIVAELLQQDGYMVELGRGTKDGGKDIVAVKEVPGCGLIMSVWQAKKLNRENKVDIHVIRELADTRIQNGASKGVIVTTTSLTKDALKRIEQDRYLLHKVDGEDLATWIQQTRK